MNITRTDTGELTAIIKIELSIDDYSQKVEKELKNIQKKYTMPGFRQGKVPFSIVKKKFEESTIVDEVNSIVTETINNYVEQNNLDIIGSPILLNDNAVIDWTNISDIDFSFQIGFVPKFDVDLSSMPEITKYKIIVDDNKVEEQINRLRKYYGTIVNPEISEESNLIFFDYLELDENNTVKENGITGNSMLLPKFLVNDKDLFIGKKTGDEIIFNPKNAMGNISEIERMFKISNEKAETLNSSFKFVITAIEDIIPLDIDQELFKKIYPDKIVNSEEEFKELVRADITKNYENTTKQHFINQVYETLKKEIKFNLPDDFLKLWLKTNSEKDINIETFDNEYLVYADAIKTNFIEDKIISSYNIEVTHEEIKNYIINIYMNDYKHRMGKDASEDKEILSVINNLAEKVINNKEEANKIRQTIIKDKIYDLFMTSLNIIEKEVTYEEYDNFVKETN